MLRKWVVLAFIAFLLGANAFALEQILAPELEPRARALFSQLRCVVCQNQSIGNSDADVARDLRQIVREMIAAGKSDDQVREFLVARYGEFILLKPVVAWHTILLWGAPLALLIGGGLLAWSSARARRGHKDEANLSDKEEADLAKILGDGNS